MFGFKVLTWNTPYNKDYYSASVKGYLFGGSLGHSAAELVIPKTSENQELLETYNKMGKLIVREEKTIVSEPIEKEPYYELKEVECYRIYFSFWGDVKTKKTREQHRMVDSIRDRIEEDKGVPYEYTEKGRIILQEIPNKLNRIKWDGLISHTYGTMGIERIHHLSGLSAVEISETKTKLDILDELDHEKELVLWCVKEISEKLKIMKTEEKKQQYLNSEEIKDRLAQYDVQTYEELIIKLNIMSGSITELRYELTKLGIQFGANPDGIIYFPIGSEQFEGLDYKKILIEMANIANSVIPYHGLRMNCSTAVMRVVQSGISDELRKKIIISGHSLPNSNFFIDTPQSLYDFSLNLEDILLNINVNEKTPKQLNSYGFIKILQYIIAYMISNIFKPSQKQILINNISEYEALLNNTKDALIELDLKYDIGEISESIYLDMKKNGNNLIEFYNKKILETKESLQTLSQENGPKFRCLPPRAN